MLGIDPRALRVAWTLFLFSVAIGVLFVIRATLVQFAVAIFFAYLLAPVVGLVERLVPKRRVLALGFVYIVILALLVTAGVNLVSKIVEQAASLASLLPGMMEHPQMPQIPLPDWAEPYKAKVYEATQREIKTLSASAAPFLQKVGGELLSGLSSIVPMILIPILAFFLLKDARSIRDAFIDFWGKERDRALLRDILNDIHV